MQAHMTNIQYLAWQIAEEKGFHENLRLLSARDATLIRLALIHTEVSEATQIVKRHGIEGYEEAIAEELADVVIRVADLAQTLPVHLAQAIIQKLQKNRERPYQFGTPWEGETPLDKERQTE